MILNFFSTSAASIIISLACQIFSQGNIIVKPTSQVGARMPQPTTALEERHGALLSGSFGAIDPENQLLATVPENTSQDYLYDSGKSPRDAEPCTSPQQYGKAPKASVSPKKEATNASCYSKQEIVTDIDNSRENVLGDTVFRLETRPGANEQDNNEISLMPNENILARDAGETAPISPDLPFRKPGLAREAPIPIPGSYNPLTDEKVPLRVSHSALPRNTYSKVRDWDEVPLELSSFGAGQYLRSYGSLRASGSIKLDVGELGGFLKLPKPEVEPIEEDTASSSSTPRASESFNYRTKLFGIFNMVQTIQVTMNEMKICGRPSHKYYKIGQYAKVWKQQPKKSNRPERAILDDPKGKKIALHSLESSRFQKRATIRKLKYEDYAKDDTATPVRPGMVRTEAIPTTPVTAKESKRVVAASPDTPDTHLSRFGSHAMGADSIQRVLSNRINERLPFSYTITPHMVSAQASLVCLAIDYREGFMKTNALYALLKAFGGQKNRKRSHGVEFTVFFDKGLLSTHTKSPVLMDVLLDALSLLPIAKFKLVSKLTLKEWWELPKLQTAIEELLTRATFIQELQFIDDSVDFEYSGPLFSCNMITKTITDLLGSPKGLEKYKYLTRLTLAMSKYTGKVEDEFLKWLLAQQSHLEYIQVDHFIDNHVTGIEIPKSLPPNLQQVSITSTSHNFDSVFQPIALSRRHTYDEEAESTSAGIAATISFNGYKLFENSFRFRDVQLSLRNVEVLTLRLRYFGRGYAPATRLHDEETRYNEGLQELFSFPRRLLRLQIINTQPLREQVAMIFLHNPWISEIEWLRLAPSLTHLVIRNVYVFASMLNILSLVILSGRLRYLTLDLYGCVGDTSIPDYVYPTFVESHSFPISYRPNTPCTYNDVQQFISALRNSPELQLINIRIRGKGGPELEQLIYQQVSKNKNIYLNIFKHDFSEDKHFPATKAQH